MTTLAKLYRSTSRNLEDFRFFGPRFLLRHIVRRGRVGIALPGVGRVAARSRSSDYSVIRQVFLKREYALPDQEQAGVWDHYQGILRRGGTPVIVDAGANIGVAALWFAKLFPRAQIVAVEPDPGNAALCRANAALVSNIRVEEAAIGSEPGTVSISNPDDEGWALRTARGGDIPIRTIPDILAAIQGGELFIAKIDIEGFEADLFSANLEWLSEPKVVFIEPHAWMLPGRGSSLSLQKAMARHDFEIMISGENLLYIRTANMVGTS